MALYSNERRVVIVFAKKKLLADFCQKKTKYFNFFETDVTFPFAHFFSQPLRFFTKAFRGSNCLLLNCLGNVVIDRRSKFCKPKTPVVHFLAKLIENQAFPEGFCYFFTILCLNVPSMASEKLVR